MKLFHPYYLLILLSLTTTSIAVVQFAKPGCDDMCGRVRIPFPFGIGANCAINEWYMVDCNSSTPYLSALHLEVLRVDLENQTVIVNTPINPDCSNSSQTISINLDKSPFLFSKFQNIFVFSGCGNAFMMDHGSVVTGCSTYCHNDTISEKNSSCLGITCCQTTIPRYLKSYTMNITQLERHVRVNEGSGSAFLVDKNSYEEGKLSDRIIPMSLLWTLSDLDYSDQVSCCGYRLRSNLDIGNDAAYTWGCYIPDENTYSDIEENPYLENGCYAVNKKDG